MNSALPPNKRIPVTTPYEEYLKYQRKESEERDELEQQASMYHTNGGLTRDDIKRLYAPEKWEDALATRGWSDDDEGQKYLDSLLALYPEGTILPPPIPKKVREV